jgi:hypothetical protein
MVDIASVNDLKLLPLVLERPFACNVSDEIECSWKNIELKEMSL